MKQQLDNITNITQFVLNDLEQKELIRLLDNNKLKRARLLLENIIDEKEIDMICSDDTSVVIAELKTLNEAQDLIIDLIVNEMDEMNEGKQSKQTVKQ